MIEAIYTIAMVISLITLVVIVLALIAGRLQSGGVSTGFTLFVMALMSWTGVIWLMYWIVAYIVR